MSTRNEAFQPNIGGWEVIDRRTGGLEDAEAACGLREGRPIHDDAEPLRDGFDPRGARVIPDGFLSREGFDSCGRCLRPGRDGRGPEGWSRGHAFASMTDNLPQTPGPCRQAVTT